MTVPKPPLAHAHLYLEDSYFLGRLAKITDWKAGAQPTLLIDTDKALDFGSIAIGADDHGYWVETEWFEMSFTADAVDIVLDANVRERG